MTNNLTQFSPSRKIFCEKHYFVSSSKAEKIELKDSLQINYFADCGCRIEYEYKK